MFYPSTWTNILLFWPGKPGLNLEFWTLQSSFPEHGGRASLLFLWLALSTSPEILAYRHGDSKLHIPHPQTVPFGDWLSLAVVTTVLHANLRRMYLGWGTSPPQILEGISGPQEYEGWSGRKSQALDRCVLCGWGAPGGNMSSPSKKKPTEVPLAHN